MTAHRCLFADGPVTGKTVLVAGGAGAVGHFATELAKHAGARVVTTVSGPERPSWPARPGPTWSSTTRSLAQPKPSGRSAR